MNEIMNINGIECFERNGTAYLKLETVARGLGFIRIADSGNEVVRWERVRKYLSEIGAMPTSGHDIPTSGDREKLPDFIPENIFYRLAMKAKNETAEKFQALVADEIIPSIRKTGGYIAGQEQLTDAELMARALMVAQKSIESRTEEVKSLKLVNTVQQQQIAELNPKATYYDLVLQCPDLISVTEIAKDYGKSAKWLNRILEAHKIQYRLRGIWILHQKYAKCGYTSTKTNPYSKPDGSVHTKPHTYWTQKGRLFLYEFLKSLGYLPIVEQQRDGEDDTNLREERTTKNEQK